MAEEEVRLFRTWSSPFALRAIWALELKGVPYENIFENLSSKSQLLLQYNPVHGKVPVLVHNGRAVCESLVVVEYIDETWTQNPLLPEDPLERATARFWAKFGDDKVMQSIWDLVQKGREEQEAGLAQAIESLQPLEEILKGKKFFGGEKIGFLDIALGWLSNLVPVFHEITGLKLIEEERFPLLSAWMKDFSGFPTIRETLPPHDKLVTKFRAQLEALRAKSRSQQ
ncbi:probable glutathione S-transferase [Punica granatum]|uniref:glutathione transferase n=2 Tax=Punica granatum TaxID=22663 RepID=A0A218WJL5_PUNGR|nr:probable glutathione S-transferase [Punica granatum]XP_031381593.1 probable glutathione S-transferase [Punica granatum]OWM72649.1 hypothetical protein CDL15_Pgr013117 [Punica granatum]PKH89610.1 hypothetical protein CRG98_049945 [Punica granatum]